jgi:orotidine-5'-phosphate decarboxylase
MHVAGNDQVHKALNIPDCDYIVVGRPITKSSDPKAAVEKIKTLIAVKEEACAA